MSTTHDSGVRCSTVRVYLLAPDVTRICRAMNMSRDFGAKLVVVKLLIAVHLKYIKSSRNTGDRRLDKLDAA